MRGSALCLIVVGFLLSFNLVPSVVGQTAVTGALTIQVRDASGAGIPAAKLTITNLASGDSRDQQTDASGDYTFALLPPGAYKVIVSASGFKTLTVPSAQVDVTETHVLAEKLDVGSVEQQVEVNSGTLAVQTETATLGNVVSGTAITGLPLVTRNYTQILALSPGVTADVYNATQLGRGSQPTYVNGLDNISNNYQEDGVSISNYASATPQDPASFYGAIPIPSPDAISEFKVQTSLFDAGYGRNPGGNVDVVTKSGGNDVHGSMFEFFRNDALNANGFFQNRADQPRGKLEQNQYGGVIGGAIIKNKLFWFGSYQGTKQINGVAAQGSSTVTLPEQLTNNRSAAAIGAAFCPANNPAGSPGAAYSFTYNPSGAVNPASDQVACNGSNINPVAINLLNAKLPNGTYVIPSPQTILNQGTANAVGFSSFSVPARFTENQALFNLDYVINPKNTISGRYFYAYAPQTQDFSNANGQPPGSGISVLSGDQLVIGKLTTTLTNNLLNEFRFSDYYIRAAINSNDPVTASSVGTKTAASYFNLMPVVTFNGLFTFGGSTVDVARAPQKYYEWSDQISWAHGKHTVRAGYDQQYVEWEQELPAFNRGTLTFQTFADFLLGESAAQNGTVLSNIYESSATIQEPYPGTINQNRANEISAFVQDDYKVNQRLTLNLGLRWEYDGTIYDENSPLNGATNAVWALDQTVPVPPAGGTFAGYTVANNYAGILPPGVVRRGVNVLTSGHAPFTNFSPRIGFAYQPFGNGQFVVRGGYGLFYDVLMGNIFEIELNNNPPSTGPLTYIGPVNALADWANPYNPLPTLGFGSFNRTATSVLSQSGLAPNLKTPYTQSYSLNLQYEFKPGWVAELGYVGSHTIDTVTGRAFDEPVLATATNPVNCDGPAGCITTNTAGNAAERVPVLGLRPGGFGSAGNWGYSNYNSMQAVLRKRFSYGLQMQASYTYGRSFTNVVGVNLQGGVAGTVNSNDPNSLTQQYGPSDFERPQRLIVSYLYDLPIPHVNSWIGDKLISGWAVSGITTAQSGEPITFTDPRGGAVYGSFSSSRAQLCPGMTYADTTTSGSIQSRLNNYFNPVAFCTPPIVGVVNGVGGATGYGDTARAVLLGPGQFNWDIALVKNTKIGGIREDGTLEFRTEFFNAFNHPMFTNPGSAVSTGSFGVISSTSVGPRIMQFALKYTF
jgi:Carboxypeptidase regulatory-like domain